MWLERIVLKDFRCFYGECGLDLSDKADKNVTLIHAENGLGKTTLLNALLWCFYGQTTARFEQKGDLVNHDALAEGRSTAFVEVLFEHNDKRYRARRNAGAAGAHASDRPFTIMRLESGHSTEIPNPDTFINSVMPKGMAGHFLFDGEHAEVFTAEANRASIRGAVQDILGCSLIDTAIKDLGESSGYYRKQMPKKASSTIEALSNQIDALTGQIDAVKGAREQFKSDIESMEQQVADIDGKLRDSAAAKALAGQRESLERELGRAQKRERDAVDETIRWLGDNGRYLVSRKITETTFDHLEAKENKGRIPSPYNEEFVKDLLELGECICGAGLIEGSAARAKVTSLLERAANQTLRDRLNAIRARLSQLKLERDKAPGRLAEANTRLTEARTDIARLEAELAEISAKLSGIDFDEIAAREKRRNELRRDIGEKRTRIGELNNRIAGAEADKAAKDRDLKQLADQNADTRIFSTRHALCELLKGRLETELVEEEKEARRVLRTTMGKVLGETTKKAFRLRMSDDYVISLVNDAGTQLPKSTGENQLLGLIFTAALVEYARLRQNANDYRLLRGTVAPLVLDSPFGSLDESYRQTTAHYVPEMAGQVVLMISKMQAAGGVAVALEQRVGKEYVLVRHNKGERGDRTPEYRQLDGRDYELTRFEAAFDGTEIVEVR